MSESLSRALFGDEVEARDRAFEIILGSEAFSRGLEEYEDSTAEARVSCTRKMVAFSSIVRTNPQLEEHLSEAAEMLDASFSIRMFVQRGLWMGTLRAHATPEQLRRFLPGSEEWKTRGCFCMTELGHSSFLRGSETRATYVPSRDEIELHSEGVLATKWWIGQAGQAATHGIVFAQLRTPQDGDCGIQLFVCPLRDPQSGAPMPGVEIGDLGPKYGRHGNDNGFIRFNRVRIPRSNMLAKFAKLDASGRFQPAPFAALAYSSTVLERVGALRTACNYAATCLTIATRYALRRRQGPGRDASRAEQLIMDYQTHQVLLMPHLAYTYAYFFVAQREAAAYRQMLLDMERGDLSGMLQMHAASCGLKAFSGWWATEALEACRRSMGGHAYHAYSGIGQRICDFGVVTTGGGDNVVIAQQLSRFLVKSLEHEPSSSFFYLNEKEDSGESAASMGDFSSAASIVALFRSMSRRCVATAKRQLASSSWGASQVTLVEAAEAHTLAHTIAVFADNAHSHQVLQRLLELVAVDAALRHLDWLALAGFPAAQVSDLKVRHVALCAEVRRDAATLVDAFRFPDAALRSPFGAKDSSSMYDDVLQAVRDARINRDQVAPYWHLMPKL